MLKNFTKVGITDCVTACECCGKPDLKRTVELMDEEGNVEYYGTTCAAKALNVKSRKIENVVAELQRHVDHKAKIAAAREQARAAFEKTGEAHCVVSLRGKVFSMRLAAAEANRETCYHIAEMVGE